MVTTADSRGVPLFGSPRRLGSSIASFCRYVSTVKANWARRNQTSASTRSAFRVAFWSTSRKLWALSENHEEFGNWCCGGDTSC